MGNIQPDINYYDIVAKFAEEQGFSMSCSNGVFKLGPTPVSVQDYRETAMYQQEVADFKAKNPEYANMKGIKPKTSKSVYYGRFDLSVGSGQTKNGSLRTAQMFRRLEWLITGAPYQNDSKNFLKKLYSNSYRFLGQASISLKFPSTDELQRIFLDLEYLQVKTRRNKKYIKLTEEGKNYVRQSRIIGNTKTVI